MTMEIETDSDLGTYESLVEADRPDDQRDREQLRKERDEWKYLFNQLVQKFPEPIFAVDDERRLRYFNSEAEDAYGRSQDEAIGTKGYEFFGTEGESEILAETVARTEETVWEEEFREVPTPDGILWNRSMAVPMETLDGTVIGAVEMTPIFTGIVEERNQMAAVQKEVSEEISTAIGELRENATDVATRSAESTDIADDQSEQMVRVNAEVSELSASIEEVAATATEVTETSNRARELAVEGREGATEVIELMEAVSEAADETADAVTHLRERVDEIDEIVDVIDDIADQTNMLALNASIEAARADQGGEGFAVVADEIKTLANESQEQATEIEQTVDEVKTRATETVETIGKTAEKLSDGVDRTETVMERLSEITEVITETAEGIEDVAAAADDQATSTETVASMVDDVVESAEELVEELDAISGLNRTQADLVEEIEGSIEGLESLLDDVAVE